MALLQVVRHRNISPSKLQQNSRKRYGCCGREPDLCKETEALDIYNLNFEGHRQWDHSQLGVCGFYHQNLSNLQPYKFIASPFLLEEPGCGLAGSSAWGLLRLKSRCHPGLRSHLQRLKQHCCLASSKASRRAHCFLSLFLNFIYLF